MWKINMIRINIDPVLWSKVVGVKTIEQRARMVEKGSWMMEQIACSKNAGAMIID